MDYKKEEIREYFNDYIKENDQFIGDEIELDDLHHEVFNTSFYIIGNEQAKQWCGDKVFEIINFIKDYLEELIEAA